MNKPEPGSKLFIKFTLSNNHFIIFNAEEITDSMGIFEIELKAEKALQEWLNNRIDKQEVNLEYYKPKVSE